VQYKKKQKVTVLSTVLSCYSIFMNCPTDGLECRVSIVYVIPYESSE